MVMQEKLIAVALDVIYFKLFNTSITPWQDPSLLYGSIMNTVMFRNKCLIVCYIGILLLLYHYESLILVKIVQYDRGYTHQNEIKVMGYLFTLKNPYQYHIYVKKIVFLTGRHRTSNT